MKLSSGWTLRVILWVGLLLGMVRSASAAEVPGGIKIWLPLVMGGVPNGPAILRHLRVHGPVNRLGLVAWNSR